MHDFACADPDEMYDEELAKATRYYKEVQRGGRKMCQVMDEIKEKGRDEGRLEDIKRIMESLALTMEQALDILQIPAGERDVYCSGMEKLM